MDYIIRAATIDDAEAMLAIYEPYVEETAITFETVMPTLADFRNRVLRIGARYPWILTESAEEGIVGYAYAGPFKQRAAYDWSVETSIYLRRDIRGRGFFVGTFHGCGFKLGRWYDMLWMEKAIGAHDGAPTPVVPFSQL